MSEPRHLEDGARPRLRLITHPGAHRVPRASTIAKGPRLRVPDLADELDLDGELEALLAAASQARHPAGGQLPSRDR